MSTLEIKYESSDFLACAGCPPSDVFLCVPEERVAPHVCPACFGEEEPENETYEFRYIEATLEKVCRVFSSCQITPTWRYTFSYDDAQIAVGQELDSDDIEGVVCDGCLIHLVQDFVGNEVCMVDNDDGTVTFTSQHGCEFTFATGGNFSITDTDSVDLTLTDGTLSADVNISADDGNILEIREDGLYVNTMINRANIVQQTTTIANQTETTILTATASESHDLLTLLIANSSQVDSTVTIRDDTAGSAIMTIQVPASDTRGVVFGADSPFKQTAQNKNWTAQSSVTAVNLYVTVEAFKAV